MTLILKYYLRRKSLPVPVSLCRFSHGIFASVSHLGALCCQSAPCYILQRAFHVITATPERHTQTYVHA